MLAVAPPLVALAIAGAGVEVHDIDVSPFLFLQGIDLVIDLLKPVEIGVLTLDEFENGAS